MLNIYLPVIDFITAYLILLVSLLAAAPCPYLSSVIKFFLDIFISICSNSTFDDSHMFAQAPIKITIIIYNFNVNYIITKNKEKLNWIDITFKKLII